MQFLFHKYTLSVTLRVPPPPKEGGSSCFNAIFHLRFSVNSSLSVILIEYQRKRARKCE